MCSLVRTGWKPVINIFFENICKELLLTQQLTNKRNLHGKHKSQDKESGISCIDSIRESSHEQQCKHVERDQVDNKHVSTPSRNLKKQQRVGWSSSFFYIFFSQDYHVKVGQGSQCCPEHGPCLNWLDPQEVGKHQGKNSNAFIIITSSYWATDVSRYNCNEAGG